MTGDLVCNTTGALRFPSGTTAQRPSGNAGDNRFNNTTGYPEYHNGTSWVSQSPDLVQTVDAGGWGGSDPLDPGGIAHQYVSEGTVSYDFTVRPVTLTPGIWIVTANAWLALEPDRPSDNTVHSAVIILPYQSDDNPEITYSSKADVVITQSAMVTPFNVEMPIQATYAITSSITFNKIRGYWRSKSDNSNRDLKINCWYTGIKIQ